MSSTTLPKVIAENTQLKQYDELSTNHQVILRSVKREDLEFFNASRRWADITNPEWKIHDSSPLCLRIKKSAWKKYEIPSAKNPVSSSEKSNPEERVIYSGPATVVTWIDGTKTVVKVCEGDTFDPVFGYLIAYYQKNTGKSHHQTSKKFAALRALHAESLPKPLTLKKAPIKASKSAKVGKKPATRKKAKA